MQTNFAVVSPTELALGETRYELHSDYELHSVLWRVPHEITFSWRRESNGLLLSVEGLKYLAVVPAPEPFSIDNSDIVAYVGYVSPAEPLVSERFSLEKDRMSGDHLVIRFESEMLIRFSAQSATLLSKSRTAN